MGLQELTKTEGRMRIRRWFCERFHRVAGPWQDANGMYERCMECGRRIPWTDPLPLPEPTQRPAQ